MQLEIKKALPEEYDKIRFFYYSLIDSLEGTKYHPMWAKDIYPGSQLRWQSIRSAMMSIKKSNGLHS